MDNLNLPQAITISRLQDALSLQALGQGEGSFCAEHASIRVA